VDIKVPSVALSRLLDLADPRGDAGLSGPLHQLFQCGLSDSRSLVCAAVWQDYNFDTLRGIRLIEKALLKQRLQGVLIETDSFWVSMPILMFTSIPFCVIQRQLWSSYEKQLRLLLSNHLGVAERVTKFN